MIKCGERKSNKLRPTARLMVINGTLNIRKIGIMGVLKMREVVFILHEP